MNYDSVHFTLILLPIVLNKIYFNLRSICKKRKKTQDTWNGLTYSNNKFAILSLNISSTYYQP